MDMGFSMVEPRNLLTLFAGLGCAYSITNVQANVLSYPGLLSWHYGRGTQRHKVANHWESEESIKVGAQHSIT